MNRKWLITVEKPIADTDETAGTDVTVHAASAQQAAKQLVDLTTNNSRVVFFSV